ncbi:MAG: hypothetical protein Q8S09_11435 [Hyphomonas sp.]|nr:hypothetical protein [Hyphomonas sp.]
MKAGSLLAAGLLGLAACASGGGAPQVKWSASSWNGLAPQTLGTDNYNFFAAPLDGQGFKLKLSLVTDGSFRIQEGEDTLPAELEQAARAAAPEGCTFLALTRTEDGGAEAEYDCP